MPQVIQAANSITVRFDVYIDGNDQLRVGFHSARGERRVLNPDRGLEDILAAYRSDGAVTLQVNDFFQRGTVYEVYGAILEQNGHTIAAYWEPTGKGQQYTFKSLPREGAGKIRLVIGALPRRRDAAVPNPLASRTAHPFTGSVDPPPEGPDK